jgi:hypothetical protein
MLIKPFSLFWAVVLTLQFPVLIYGTLCIQDTVYVCCSRHKGEYDISSNAQ